MKIEQWAIDKIKPYPKNARKIPQKAIDKVALSLREFGWQQPIVVDKKSVIVAGHTRWLAAQQNEYKTCPVLVADKLTPAKIRAYRLMDNRSHQETDWDLDLLTVELGELKGLNVDLDLTGFAMREVSGHLRREVVEDEAPEPPKIPVSRTGDLWVLGEHRLLCGDCTKAEDVQRVMNGERAGLMNTDPPYGVGYANDQRPNPGVAKPRVAGDTLSDSVLQDFLEYAFSGAKEALKDNAAWYLWHAHLTQGFFAAAAAAAAAAAVILHRQIIWIKPVLLLGRGMYHWKHEPCFMGWVEGNRPPDYAARTQTTVWEIGGVNQADRKEFNHSTPKPIALFQIPIEKHLLEGEICYEPFSGSGPQFIAAEQLNRRCFGLEIEPAYCDVIVKRWEKFTGKEACNEDGETFASVTASRKAKAA